MRNTEFFAKKRSTEERRVERLTAERDALWDALVGSYRATDLSFPVDLVAFLPSSWHDFHEAPSAGLCKWTEADVEALVARVRTHHFAERSRP